MPCWRIWSVFLCVAITVHFLWISFFLLQCQNISHVSYSLYSLTAAVSTQSASDDWKYYDNYCSQWQPVLLTANGMLLPDAHFNLTVPTWYVLQLASASRQTTGWQQPDSDWTVCSDEVATQWAISAQKENELRFKDTASCQLCTVLLFSISTPDLSQSNQSSTELYWLQKNTQPHTPSMSKYTQFRAF